MTTPSAGAMRAAALCDSQYAAYEQREMQGDRTPRAKRLQELAAIIDDQTNHAALVEAAKVIVQDPIRSEYDPSCVVIHESDIDRLRDAIAKAGA